MRIGIELADVLLTLTQGNDRLSRIDFQNTTHLSSDRLQKLCQDCIAGWNVGTISLRIRYSRSADFSGTCFYQDRRIFVNIGKHLVYPYRMNTHLARSVSMGRRWFKPVYTLELKDGYPLVMFIFMHELYHLLVRKARRNMRQKESMCDRFAARYVVDRYGASVNTIKGEWVPREVWDFQDVERFVAAARRKARAARTPITIQKSGQHNFGEQLVLFEN